MSDDEDKRPEPAEGNPESVDEAAAAADDVADAGEAPAVEAEASVAPDRRRQRRSTPAGTEASSTAAAARDDEPEAGAKAAGDAGGTAKAAAPDDDAERRDLPKWNRARVKRKAPKGEEQDAFQTSVRKAGRGLMERPWAVIGIIVALAGVGAGIYAWRARAEAKRAEATSILASAVAFEARGQVMEDIATVTAERVRPLPLPIVASEDELRQQVDEALSNLEAEAGDSPANEVADLVRAARLARALDFEGAEEAYRGFLRRQPGHALVFLAREGLVLSLEGQERWDDALRELEPLIGEEGDFYRDQALWHRGRLQEEAGLADEALATYRQYMAEYPLDQQSLAVEGVRARLEELDPGAVPPRPSSTIPGMPGLGGFGP